MIVNGTVDYNPGTPAVDPDTIGFAPTAPDAATLTGVQGVAQVNVATVESVVINGLGGNDRLNVDTPAGLNTVTYTPGRRWMRAGSRWTAWCR